MKILEFLSGALAGVIGDLVLHNIIQALSTATPQWATYGWGLFVAFNTAIVLWLRNALK